MGKCMRTKELQEGISAAILPVLGEIGYALVEVRLVVSHGRRTVRVFIHKPDGITVDDCAVASRAIGAILDDSDLFRGRYYLEVSSPGAERPLRGREDFQLFMGRKALIRVRKPEGGVEEVKGRIKSLEEDILGIELENGTLFGVPFEKIAKANLSL